MSSPTGEEDHNSQHPDNSSISKRSVLLIDDSTMTREALLLTLQARCRGSFDVSCTNEIVGSQNITATMAILNIRSARFDHPQVMERVEQLRAVPHDPILGLITETDDDDLVAEAMRFGFRAYFTTSMTSDMVVAAINLVLTGGLFVPPSFLMRRGLIDRPFAPLPAVAIKGLTERQKQVLKLLLQGKPNKVIARELELTEATVKHHLHQIMRKRGVRTRMELAAAHAHAPQSSQPVRIDMGS